MHCSNHGYGRKGGFTLVELLLYVGLMSIMMLAMASFFPVLFELRVKNQTVAEVEQQGIQVMQAITQAIRNADAIDAPNPGETNDSLDLFSPSSLERVRFDLSGEALEMIEDGGEGIPLTNSRVSVSDLLVKNLSRPGTHGVINVQFTISYRNFSGGYAYDFSKTFYGGAALRSP